MPYIKVDTNVVVENKEKIKSLLGSIITTIPGKKEWMTAVSINDNSDLYFGGSSKACAVVDTLVNAGTDHSRNKEYSDAIINMISEELKIPRNRIYVIVQEQDYWFAVSE